MGRGERMDLTKGEGVLFKAPAGSAVVLDYLTGEVIAMASYPTFDNRWFEAGLSSAKFKQIFPVTEDPDKSILVNRAVQGRYNLGSTFKPFTAFAALSTGLITSTELFTDTGSYQLYSVDQSKCRSGLVRCEYKNATCGGTGRPCVYGDVDVEDALAVSSDAFFYRIGEDILERNGGLPVLQDQVELFGFGADSGVELPFEFDGTVPDRELKRLYAERGVISEDEGRGFYVGDNVQLAIGQGLLSATPLQLANGYSAIANGGFLLQPTIIRAIWNPGVPDGKPGFADFEQGTVYEDYSEPTLIRQISMPDETRNPIVQGLERVIYGPGVVSDYPHKTTGEHLFLNYPAATRRSRSAARPVPPRAPTTTRGTTRRRSPASAPTTRPRTSSRPISRRPATAHKRRHRSSSVRSWRCPGSPRWTPSSCPSRSISRRPCRLRRSSSTWRLASSAIGRSSAMACRPRCKRPSELLTWR